jgi:protein-S-isoprenylcysteine O-methyltransferase Ste14
VFFIVAPGTVVGLVPWLLTKWQMRHPTPYWWPLRVIGVLLLVAGLLFVMQAFARFVVEGIGTPAPVAPTQRLVVGGVYRYVRNPMYLALLAVIIGQALLFGQLVLLAYAALNFAVVATFVRLYEEPTLARQFGDEYQAYRHAVPAWWPRLRPWRPTTPGGRSGR